MQTFTSHHSGGWKPTVKAPACSISGESSLPGWQTAAVLLTRSRGWEGGRERELQPSFL